MAPDVFRLFHAIGVPLRNIYGSTEIGIMTIHKGERYDLETVGHWLEAHPETAALEWKVSPAASYLYAAALSFRAISASPRRAPNE